MDFEWNSDYSQNRPKQKYVKQELDDEDDAEE